MSPITILLVDDHRLIRETWLEVLNSDDRFQVTGSASTCWEGIERAATLQPAIVLMDINLSDGNGFDATKAILVHSPGSKVIGVSMHAMPTYAKKMLKLGARGYVTKNSGREELVLAILKVHTGEIYICNEIKDILSEQEHDPKGKTGDLSILTGREIEIAKLIRDGMSSRKIAEHLDLSSKTVDVHRHNMLKKLHLKNAAMLINFINDSSL